MAQYDKKKLFDALHISGTIYHVIVLYGTFVLNHNISRFFFNFFKILILWVVVGGGGRVGEGSACVKAKMVQNEKKKSVCCAVCLKNHSSHDHHLWYRSLKW